MVPIGPGRRAAFNAELAPAEAADHSNPPRGLAGLLTHQPSAMFSRSPPRARHIYVRTGLRDHGAEAILPNLASHCSEVFLRLWRFA
jgi:hypothetical protein